MSGRDGGPAFPHQELTQGGVPAEPMYRGVSVRDYFAGQALVGWMANPNGMDSMIGVAKGQDRPLEELAAIAAYRIADAMLAEREVAS